MGSAWKLLIVRVSPVVFIAMAAGFWFNDVQEGGPWVLRNLLPLLLLVLMSVVTLYLGGGQWAGAGKRLPLGVLGFSIPVLGLSIYLHHAYAVNLNGMFNGAAYPDRVFQYLPFYTVVAGTIGFAIGWIIGRKA